MQDRQGCEERDGQYPAAEDDKNGQRAHAAVPQAAHAGEQEADPLGAQLSRADERHQGCGKCEGQAGD